MGFSVDDWLLQQEASPTNLWVPTKEFRGLFDNVTIQQNSNRFQNILSEKFLDTAEPYTFNYKMVVVNLEYLSDLLNIAVENKS